MVAICGREVLRRAADVLCAQYNRCLDTLFYGQPTVPSRSISFVQTSLSNPPPKLAPKPLKKTWSQTALNGRIPKGRRKGRVQRRRYNEIAKENSTIFVPGGFPKTDEKEKKPDQKDTDDDGYQPIDRDLETTEEAQAGWTLEGPQPDHEAFNERQAFVKKELQSLLFEKDKREAIFKAKMVSERVKAHAGERKARLKRETKEAERLWKMQEIEKREERERADRWKDKRLAQLEKEKLAAESELAREKVERKQSKLQRVFKEQQRRRRDEEHWKQLRDKDAKSAAQREEKLERENAMLQDNMRATDDAFQKASNEKEHLRQEKEEERARRLRAEESLYRWRELMKEYFPEDEQEEHPGKLRRQPSLPPSLAAQFKLYEKKWEVLRSGLDIDGTKVHLIFFSQIPWPVINMTPTDPSQLLPERIKQFLIHPLREKPDSRGLRKTRRSRARDELKRWHSDKFNQIVLSKVREEDRQAASEAAGMVARVLTEMLS